MRVAPARGGQQFRNPVLYPSNLACRALSEHQRKNGIIWGVAGALILRVTLPAVAVMLLSIPYLKILGGLLLPWIGWKLIIPEHNEGGPEIDASTSLVDARSS